MVQAAENLTTISARVVDVTPHPTLAGWALVDAEIVAADPVEGYADLISQRAGEQVPVAVPADVAARLVPGAMLSCRARLHLGEVMAEPHPEPSDVEVTGPDGEAR